MVAGWASAVIPCVSIRRAIASAPPSCAPGFIWAHTNSSSGRGWGQCSALLVVLAAIEFVRFLEAGKIFGSRGFGINFEVGMLQRVYSVDALTPVQLEQFCEQVQSFRV